MGTVSKGQNLLLVTAFAVGFAANFFSRFSVGETDVFATIVFALVHLLSLIGPAAYSYYRAVSIRGFLSVAWVVSAFWVALSMLGVGGWLVDELVRPIANGFVMAALGLLLFCLPEKRLATSILCSYAVSMLVMLLACLITGLGAAMLWQGLYVVFLALLLVVVLVGDVREEIPCVKALTEGRKPVALLKEALLSRQRTVFSMVVVQMLLMVIMGLFEGNAQSGGFALISSAASIVGAFLVVLVLALLSLKRDFSSWLPAVFSFLMLVCIVGLLLASVLPERLPLLSGFFGVSMLLYVVATCLVVVETAKEQHISLLFLYGTILALLSGLYYAGDVLGVLLHEALNASASSISIVAIVSLAAVAAFVVMLSPFVGKVTPAESARESAGVAKEIAKLANPGESETTFLELARERGLSDREAEIGLLYARGRSVPYISDRCFISAGTVKSHLKKVYAKLGVHSKQELIDLVNTLDG